MKIHTNKRLIAAAAVMAFTLTGCGSVPDLDHVNRDMEAEYMAGALLKYDKNNDDMLDYDRSILRATPTPTPAPTSKPVQTTATPSGSAVAGNDSDGTGEVAATVPAEKVFDLKQVDIKMMSSELKQTYGSADAAVTAHSGSKLYIVHFRVKNQASIRQKVNLLKKDLEYTLVSEGEVLGKPLMTILQNDLQYYKENMKAGRNSEAVLVFEIDGKQKLQNPVIQVTDGKVTGEIAVY